MVNVPYTRHFSLNRVPYSSDLFHHSNTPYATFRTSTTTIVENVSIDVVTSNITQSGVTFTVTNFVSTLELDNYKLTLRVVDSGNTVVESFVITNSVTSTNLSSSTHTTTTTLNSGATYNVKILVENLSNPNTITLNKPSITTLSPRIFSFEFEPITVYNDKIVFNAKSFTTNTPNDNYYLTVVFMPQTQGLTTISQTVLSGILGSNLPSTTLAFTTGSLVDNEAYDIQVYVIETASNTQYFTTSSTNPVKHYVDGNGNHVFTTDTTQSNSTYTITTLPPEIISIQTSLASRTSSELVIQAFNFVSNYPSDVYSIVYVSPLSRSLTSSVTNGNLSNTNNTFTSLLANTNYGVIFEVTNTSKPLSPMIPLSSIQHHHVVNSVHTLTNDSTITHVNYFERTLQTYTPTYDQPTSASATHTSITINVSNFTTPSDYASENYTLQVECRDTNGLLVDTQSSSSFVGNAFTAFTLAFNSLANVNSSYTFTRKVLNTSRPSPDNGITLTPTTSLSTTLPPFTPTISVYFDQSYSNLDHDSFSFNMLSITHSHAYYSSDAYTIYYKISHGGTIYVSNQNNPNTYVSGSAITKNLTSSDFVPGGMIQNRTYTLEVTVTNTTHNLSHVAQSQTFTVPYEYIPDFTISATNITSTSIDLVYSNFSSPNHTTDTYTLVAFVGNPLVQSFTLTNGVNGGTQTISGLTSGTQYAITPIVNNTTLNLTTNLDGTNGTTDRRINVTPVAGYNASVTISQNAKYFDQIWLDITNFTSTDTTSTHTLEIVVNNSISTQTITLSSTSQIVYFTGLSASTSYTFTPTIKNPNENDITLNTVSITTSSITTTSVLTPNPSAGSYLTSLSAVQNAWSGDFSVSSSYSEYQNEPFRLFDGSFNSTYNYDSQIIAGNPSFRGHSWLRSTTDHTLILDLGSSKTLNNLMFYTWRNPMATPITIQIYTGTSMSSFNGTSSQIVTIDYASLKTQTDTSSGNIAIHHLTSRYFKFVFPYDTNDGRSLGNLKNFLALNEFQVSGY